MISSLAIVEMAQLVEINLALRKQAPALPNTGDASNPAMALPLQPFLGGTALAMKKRKKKKRSKVP